MAIKGKSKARGRPRAAGNAPRPVIVPRKKPFFARRSTQIGLVVLLLAGIAAILLAAWTAERRANERERLGQGIERVNGEIQSAVQAIAEPGPGGELLMLPQFVQELQAFRDGTTGPAPVRQSASALPALLEDAATAIGDVEVPEELRGTEHGPVVDDAAVLMVQGLRAYRTAAQLVVMATDAEGRVRDQLLARASDQVQMGATLWDAGFRKIQQIRRELETFDESADVVPGTEGEIPGLPGIPGMPGQPGAPPEQPPVPTP